MNKPSAILLGIGTIVVLLVLIRIIWERWWRGHFGKPRP